MKQPIIVLALLLLPSLALAQEKPGFLGSPLHINTSLGIAWYDDWNQSLDPQFQELRPAYSAALKLSAPEYFGALTLKGQFDLDLRPSDKARRAQFGIYYDF